MSIVFDGHCLSGKFNGVNFLYFVDGSLSIGILAEFPRAKVVHGFEDMTRGKKQLKISRKSHQMFMHAQLSHSQRHLPKISTLAPRVAADLTQCQGQRHFCGACRRCFVAADIGVRHRRQRAVGALLDLFPSKVEVLPMLILQAHQMLLQATKAVHS